MCIYRLSPFITFKQFSPTSTLLLLATHFSSCSLYIFSTSSQKNTRGHMLTHAQPLRLHTINHMRPSTTRFIWFINLLCMRPSTNYIHNWNITIAHICNLKTHEGTIWTLWPSNNHTLSVMTIYGRNPGSKGVVNCKVTIANMSNTAMILNG